MSNENPAEQGGFGAPGPQFGGGSDPTTPIPPPPAGGYSYQPTSPGPGPVQPAGSGAHGGPRAGGGEVGFLAALFDFSFTHFVTPKLVRVVYILLTVLLALVYLSYLVLALASGSFGLALGVLVGGGLAFLIYLALARMSLEFFLALVRMSEDVHKRLPAG